MPIRPRPPAFRPAAALLAALLLMAVTAGSATAAPTSAAPGSGGVLRAAPTSAAAVAGGLERATGHTPAQLSTRQVCGAAAPGRIRCLAQLLTIRGTDRAVPLLRPLHARPMHTASGDSRVRAAGTGTSAPAANTPAATVPAAIAEPQPYTAAFLQWAYDTTWLSANNGAGDTVAIVDAYDDPTAYSDMEAFRSANGLPSLPQCTTSTSTGCFQLVNQYGSATPLPSQSADETGSWNIEESLDIDAVSALCPRCKILMVEANSDSNSNLDTGVQTAAGMGANQISMSWGSDVPLNAKSSSSNSYPYTSITNSALLAAAGDGSYPGQYTVGYPAALANVTAVGGTSLTGDPTAARGFAESAWAIQTCSGGSTCGTESGCDTSQGIPTYQQGLTTECSGRAYNDISADADPNTGLAIYDSQPVSEGCQTSNNMCIVGGTSLATPLTAAFEAITGVGGPSAGSTSPSWAYGDAAKLNDIVSGSDGTCPAGESVICTAGTGWDGPTGNGSISGDIVAGGPGIGSSATTGVNANDVTLSGGVYANGAATSYHWTYWISGDSSSAISTGAGSTAGVGATPVSHTLCGALKPSQTYDYELTASNTSGSQTGYQGSFTTPATESSPSASAGPTIAGSAVTGETLIASDANWNDQACNSSPTYQWLESSSPAGPWTTVGSSLTYAVTSSDVGQYLQFASTESNSAGSSTVRSPIVGPVALPAVTVPTTTTTTTTTTTPTPTPTLTTPAPPSSPTLSAQPSTLTAVRFYRCIHRCVLIDTHGASSYRTRRADYGRYIKVVTTFTRTTGDRGTRTVRTRWFGPIVAPAAGVVSIGTGARVAATLVVRGATHRPLALVRVTGHHGSWLTLAITRAGRLRTRYWAYVVSRGAVRLGTAPRLLSPRSRLRIALRRGQTLKLVAVAT